MPSLEELEKRLRAIGAELEAIEKRTFDQERRLVAIEAALIPQDAGERLRRCRALLEYWGHDV